MKYINSKGAEIVLDEWPYMIQDPENLLEWSYNIEKDSLVSDGAIITNMRQEAKETTVIVAIFADTEKEFRTLQKELCKVGETDIVAEKNGKLYWDDEHYLSCRIKSGKYSDYEPDFEATDKEIGIIAENPFWIKEQKFSFHGENHTEREGLNYPHNYPHNYSAAAAGVGGIEVDSVRASEFTLTIYGACSNPSIKIGGNEYTVYCTLSTGDYLQIDSRGKSFCQKVANNGTISNQYDNRNKTVEIYQRIPAGLSKVEWSGAFSFDLTVYAEESEPF